MRLRSSNGFEWMSAALRAGLAASLAAFALTLGGCDNPACVFGGDCSPNGTGGALGTLSASVPENGQIVRGADPVLLRFEPSGTGADPRTPIVLVFSESMSNESLNIAFQLDQVGFGSLPLSATALIGDGRVLVLFPITELMPGGEYNIVYRENVKIGDRTGQEVVPPADRIAGSFTVAVDEPTEPQIVLTYPGNAETGLPPTTEIDVVFSRPIEPATVTDQSFVVEVDGAPPPFATQATPLNVSGVATDTRVFRWRMTGDDGERASLGTDREVTVLLSPPDMQIEDQKGGGATQETVTFRTLPFSAPLGATITSFPTDAIGIDDITGAADLAIEVELEDAVAGDEIAAFVFGVQPENVEVPLVVALFRTATVVDPPTSFTFTAEELDLVRTTSPLSGRVRDGTIAIAFRIRRGTLDSPVTLLDVDPAASGEQGPLLDTTAPTITGIGTSGTSTLYASDARDVVVVGRASEQLRAASVTTALGDNEIRPGEPAPVVGSDPVSNVFVAAPVRVGVLQELDQPLPFSVTVYDRAYNSGGTLDGTYVQRGAASSGAPRPFANVSVEVFDATTLAPIASAEVLTHEDLDGDVFFVGSTLTDASGRAVVDPALLGRTLVTVRADGYDLFTFDGVPTDGVSIPLSPSAQAGGTVSGLVASLDPAITLYTRNVGDTRFPRPGETLASVGSCSFDSQDQRFECAFGPLQVRARELGAISAMAVLPPSSPLLWTAPTFLRSFGLRLPVVDVAPGGTQSTAIVLDRLDTPGLDEEKVAIDAEPHVLTTFGWPVLSGTPRIRVEGLVPGLRGPLAVGQGLAFGAGLPPSTFGVRAAYAGIADPFSDDGEDDLGDLVADGTIDPDLFLRAEIVRADGARSVDRPRLSTTDSTLAPPPPITFGPTPVVLGATGIAYEVSFLDVLTDSEGQPGIHRLVLTGENGRRWTVWRLDEDDSTGPDVVVHLPWDPIDLAPPIEAGEGTAVASSWSWTSFESLSFLWTDVAREFERAGFSATEAVTVP